jgi:hypothetical protein
MRENNKKRFEEIKYIQRAHFGYEYLEDDNLYIKITIRS